MLNIFDKKEKYKVIGINEFTHERKMMSILFIKEGEGWLIAKGSDEAIM